jgi:voltage-gated potassium channel
MFILRKLTLKIIRLDNWALFFSTVGLILLSTFVMYTLEPQTFETPFNALYYTMTTFSTVGYGDFSPQTTHGRAFAMFMYLTGIGLLGVVIGKFVDSFATIKRRREEGKMKYTGENHFIILGWSKKAEIAIKEIVESDPKVEVVIVDTLERSPVSAERIHYVQGDPSTDATLIQANVKEAKAVIVFGDERIQDVSLTDGKSLLIITAIERIAPHVHSTVEIMKEEHINHFSHVKVDDFILSHETISRLAVRSAFSKNSTKIYSQLMSRQHGEDLYEIEKRVHWKTYREAFVELLNEGATLISDGGRLDINRRLDEEIPNDSILYVICNRETFDKIKRIS